MKFKLNSLKLPFFALVIVVVLTSIAVKMVGESPLTVFKILANSAFGSAENISYTLFYSTPLLLTGTAVCVALSAGLFNIGAEGQLYIGAAGAIAWGILTRHWGPNYKILVWVGGFFSAFSCGMLWGMIAGYLKTKRQTHEVIATIMMNFIALAFVNWLVLNPFKNPENQSLETIWISEPTRIGKMWLQLSPSFIFSLLLSFAVLWMLKSTWFGFRIRATGANETASKIAGISTGKMALYSMGISGGIAGLVGFQEVYCNSYRLIDSFSSGFGFTGLAIALLARGNFYKLVFAAILFGALHKGALDLDLETERVTRDLSTIIQALILVVLSVISAKRSKT